MTDVAGEVDTREADVSLLSVLRGRHSIPHMMCCLENQDHLQPIEMQPQHLVWFGQVGYGQCFK